MFLSKQQLEKLSTKRLLAYKNKLMNYTETPDWDEYSGDGLSKSSPLWQETYKNVKEILASREHIDRPGKRKKEK